MSSAYKPHFTCAIASNRSSTGLPIPLTGHECANHLLDQRLGQSFTTLAIDIPGTSSMTRITSPTDRILEPAASHDESAVANGGAEPKSKRNRETPATSNTQPDRLRHDERSRTPGDRRTQLRPHNSHRLISHTGVRGRATPNRPTSDGDASVESRACPN
jgi:hypothetical protein